VYRRTSDNYLVQRVTVGGAWQAETVINAGGSNTPSLIQQADGQYRVVYRRTSDNYLVQRVTSGGVWQAETVINSSSSYHPSLIQQADSQYRVVYIRTSDNYLVQRVTSGGVWQAETVINSSSSNYSALIKDGTSYVRIAFAEGSQLKQLVLSIIPPLQCRIGAGIIESASNPNGSYIKFSDGTMICRWMASSGIAVNEGSTGAPYSVFSYDRTSIVFPAEFKAGTVPQVCPMGYDEGAGVYWATLDGLPTTTGFTIELLGSAANNARRAYIAIGEWEE
jgi:hypothetical protein